MSLQTNQTKKKNNNNNNVRVRFAPSPTGMLHIGGARTALFNWIYSKKMGGSYILRIEDTDPERSKREHEIQICNDLNWLGLDWDEGPNRGGVHGPYRQSDRFPLYQRYIKKLLNEGKAYRCIATPEELDKMREEQKSRGENMMYDNRFRESNLKSDCGPHVIRLKTPLDGETIVEDQIKGRTVFQNQELDDFVLQRTDGTPTYNFVVVVDDIEMGVSLVLRGDDHLNNSPKQVNLYEALGASLPQFAHVPMILGDDGKRLSKRHGATSVGMYYEMGIIKEALFNYLTRLGWACGDMEIFSPSEVIEVFELSQINKAGAKWDLQKLLWCNQQWIMKLTPEDLAERARPFFAKFNIKIDEDRYLACIRSMQERAPTLVDLAKGSAFYFVADSQLEYDAEVVPKALTPERADLLNSYADMLNTIEDWSEENLEIQSKNWVKEYSDKVRAAGGKKVKMGQVLFPTRIALCGVKGGPGVFEVMQALGRNKTTNRIQIASKKCLGE
jgi:glutamyl-tRNA synthetase